MATRRVPTHHAIGKVFILHWPPSVPVPQLLWMWVCACVLYETQLNKNYVYVIKYRKFIVPIPWEMCATATYRDTLKCPIYSKHELLICAQTTIPGMFAIHCAILEFKDLRRNAKNGLFYVAAVVSNSLNTRRYNISHSHWNAQAASVMRYLVIETAETRAFDNVRYGKCESHFFRALDVCVQPIACW